MSAPQKIGQLLIARGAITERDLQGALAMQASSSERCGAILVRMGVLSEQSLLLALAEQLDISVFDARSSGVSSQAKAFHRERVISDAMVRRYGFFAWVSEGQVRVAARDTQDSGLLELLNTYLKPGETPLLSLASARDLEWIAGELSKAESALGYTGGSQDLRKLAEDAPVVELVNNILARANDTAASDIHVEPVAGGFVVRYRIDGVLRATDEYARDKFDAVVSRIKLIAGLDIAERRLPQDGRYSARAGGMDVDVRVSVIPSVRGESIVMRLLPQSGEKRFELAKLGFEADHLALFQQWMSQPDGIILVTGPTGSGKSTTLYAALEASDTEHERVLTVEDPVEYQVPGVTQFQVHPDIGFTFPAALRSILRHDPDTIMIGEIRDTETAKIAVQASLTGHRVLSTLHTNDSATAFLRLADMGVETFLVGATVRGVIAQRLVRKLCAHCATPLAFADVPKPLQAAVTRLGLHAEHAHFRQPIGCKHCDDTGYQGRTAIYEMLSATEQLKHALAQETRSHMELIRQAGASFRSLRDDGLIKAARGVTSIEEVLNVASVTVEAEPALA